MHQFAKRFLVGVSLKYPSWSLIVGAGGIEGWINSDYVTRGSSATSDMGVLSQSDLSMVDEGDENLHNLIENRYGSEFIQTNDARLIAFAIAFLNDGRVGIYQNEGEDINQLSWWEKMLLNDTEEEARNIYQNIHIIKGMNLVLPKESLIIQMRDAGLITSGSVKDKFQRTIYFF